MDTKWTPGPWAVEIHYDKTWVVAYCGDDDPWFVCEPEPYIGPGTTDRAPANAHLIAAAPDLHEALEFAYGFIADQYGDAEAQALQGEFVSKEARPVWNAICAALAKARGEA